MNIEDIKLSLARYRFTDFRLIVGSGDPYKIERNMIGAFTIERDYDNYIFPFVQVQITVPTWLYNKMIADSKNIRINMNLQYGKFSTESTEHSVPMVTEFTGKYYALMTDHTPTTYQSEAEAREKAAGTFNQGYGIGDMVQVMLLLYNEEYYNNINIMVNEILGSANLTDALTYVLNSARFSKILLSPASNRKTYNEFKITPIKALNQIMRICNEFAYFNTGAIVFFDLDCGYILDKTTTCTAWRPNEFKTTHLMSLTKSLPQSAKVGGCYSNPTEKYNMINIQPDIEVIDNTMLNAAKLGNSFMTVNATTGEIGTVNASVVGSTGMKTSPMGTYVYSSGDNSASILKTTLDQSAKILTVGMSFCPMCMLTPNKEYILTMDDPKLRSYNGKYRISKYAVAFSLDGDYYVPSYGAEFRG